MTLLPLLLAVAVSQAPVCGVTAEAPIRPTVVAYGNSLLTAQCGATVPTPVAIPTMLDAALSGGTSAGWWFVNKAVAGYTPVQIYTAYSNATTGESVACGKTRCKVLLLEGAANRLRTGGTPTQARDEMLQIVTHALANGYERVIWLGAVPMSCWASAGTNPTQQVKDYNTLMQQSCDAINATDDRLHCVFPYAALNDPAQDGCQQAAYTCDGIHFTHAGATVVRDLLLPHFQ